MLTPAYLAGVATEVVEVYAAVEQEIVNDIVKRTIRTGFISEYSMWQIQKAKEFGMFQQGVQNLLDKSLKSSSSEVKLIVAQASKDALAFDDSIYKAAGLMPLPISKSPALQALVLQGADSTAQLLSNLTKTTSIEAYDAFQSTLDKSFIKILSGAYSPQTAIHAAIKELASGGLERVAYQARNGNVHYESMESAVRRAVTTGVNQATARLQLARAEDMGCDLVEVTAHAGARPSHAVWQGKVYAVGGGRNSEYPDFEDSTGYGTGEGLCGWNCYHSFYPYFEGLSTRAFSADPAADYGRDNDEEYEEQQKQQYYERGIRAAKREVVTWEEAAKAAKASQKESVANDAYAEFQRASVKLKRREAALTEFLDKTGRTRERDREQTGKWNRSVSAKAVWANRKATQ